MTRRSIQSLARLAAAAAMALNVSAAVMAQTGPAASASSVKMKELVALMKSKQLDAFAVRENPLGNRFVAVRVVPDVQTLLVSAEYSRPTDIEYWIYNKDYATAYRELKTGTLGSQRFFVEDVKSDGLAAVPDKSGVADSVMIDNTAQVFDGPADPKKHTDKRMPAEAYAKAFAAADARYAEMLDVLINGLKK